MDVAGRRLARPLWGEHLTRAAAVVDAHAHVFPALSARYPRDVHELFPARRSAEVESFLPAMEAAGVDQAVLVPVSAHDHYVAECVRLHPGSFAAIGVADGDDRDTYPRRAELSGIRGLRVHHLGDPALPVEQLPALALLGALAEAGHVLSFYAASDQLPLLERMLAELPGLCVVLNHLGFPKPDDYRVDPHGRPTIESVLPPPSLQAVERLAAYPGVHVMFSGEYAFSHEPYPHPDLSPVVERLYDAYGAARMLWASDYPWIAEEPGYAPQLALVDSYLPGLSAADRAAILGANAQRLYGLTG